MDGVPGISQPEVAQGGTFTYDFVLRDAGLYWYHPHVMSAAQVGLRLIRGAARRGSAGSGHGARCADDRAERHRIRQQRGARTRRQRRAGGNGVRAGRRARARQRQGAADASRPRRRAATLAHRQRGEEPVLLSRSRRPAIHDRSAAMAASSRSRSRAGAAGHAGRACRCAGRAARKAERVDGAARAPLQPRLRQRRISQRRRDHDDCLRWSCAATEGSAPDGVARDHAARAPKGHARRHRPDPAAGRSRWQLGVPRQRGALLEGQAVSGATRRNAVVDDQERVEVGSPVPSPWLLLHAG